jgi:hypothetical protein
MKALGTGRSQLQATDREKLRLLHSRYYVKDWILISPQWFDSHGAAYENQSAMYV